MDGGQKLVADCIEHQELHWTDNLGTNVVVNVTKRK